jgi:HxlR-like helix-turn-helix
VTAQRLISLLAGRWTLSILADLAGGEKRHQELDDSLDGISHKVLTDTLRRAERDGYFVSSGGPPVPGREAEYGAWLRASGGPDSAGVSAASAGSVTTARSPNCRNGRCAANLCQGQTVPVEPTASHSAVRKPQCGQARPAGDPAWQVKPAEVALPLAQRMRCMQGDRDPDQDIDEQHHR